MSIPVVFAGLVVLVVRLGRSKLLQPFPNVLNQAALVVIHIDGRGDMHWRYEAETILYAAALYNLFHLISDMNHLLALPRFKRQVFRMALHLSSLHQLSPWTTLNLSFILKNVVTDTKPDSAEELSIRALNQLVSGDAAGAAESYRAVIAQDPDYFEAHHGLIRALRDAGRLEQSIAAALALTALTPDDPLAHTALSISLQQAGHIPEAEAAAARARVVEWKAQLRSSPRDPNS